MEKRIFEPIGDFGSVQDMVTIREALKRSNEIADIHIDMSELSEKIKKLNEKYCKGYQELLEYLPNLWGKYVNIKLMHKKEDEWLCEKQYNAFLTNFVYHNDCLFGIYCLLDDPYCASFQYTSLDLRETIEKNRIEFQEITKEEFVKRAKENIDKCLQHRLNKINSGDYELTLNGYEHKPYKKTYFL